MAEPYEPPPSYDGIPNAPPHPSFNPEYPQPQQPYYDLACQPPPDPGYPPPQQPYYDHPGHPPYHGAPGYQGYPPPTYHQPKRHPRQGQPMHHPRNPKPAPYHQPQYAAHPPRRHPPRMPASESKTAKCKIIMCVFHRRLSASPAHHAAAKYD